jgi:MYXO-CTERM domain-containing protein
MRGLRAARSTRLTALPLRSASFPVVLVAGIRLLGSLLSAHRSLGADALRTREGERSVRADADVPVWNDGTMAPEEPPPTPPDPSGIEEPHDVLAAEEFAMPTRDERYPADPTGNREPHDVLAADEFAMPTPGTAAEPSEDEGSSLRIALPLVALGLVLILLRRRRRR